MKCGFSAPAGMCPGQRISIGTFREVSNMLGLCPAGMFSVPGGTASGNRIQWPLPLCQIP